MTIIPIILSGGVGARLWPVSRELHPKPFMRLADGESLLQKTFARAAAIPGVAEIITVTNRDLYFKTEDDYRVINTGGVATSYILEPFGRNTAPAIACAALIAADDHGEDALLLVFPADHLISKHEAFEEAVGKACNLAREGHLVTFGVEPTAPETGYGYIEAEGAKVLRFVEKPNLDKAKEYLASGRYLWNAGMFCFRAGTLLAQLEQYAPDVLAAARACVAASDRARKAKSVQVELNAESFAKVPDISIDYAVMERTGVAAVVPCEIGWSDIGSWNAVSDLSAPEPRATQQRPHGAARHAGLLLPERPPGRRRRRARPGGDRHPRRPAGRPQGPRAGRQAAVHPAEGVRRRSPQAAPHRASSLGHLFGARGRRELQDQAHRSQARAPR
jgi:mannose-1-phosphate guanylyltransferase/mannose-6-phosphate isomerase